MSVSSFTFTNITTLATTVVKDGQGVFKKITFNKTGTTDVITLYDGITAGGRLIATITGGVVGNAFDYDVRFNRGLTVVTSGGAAGDYTISFR